MESHKIFDIIEGKLIKCNFAKTENEILIPKDVKEICSNAFNEGDLFCETVVLPEGLEKLNDGWSGLKENIILLTKNIPSTIKFIGKNALPFFFSPEAWVSRYAKEEDCPIWRDGIDCGWNLHYYLVLPYSLKTVNFNWSDLEVCVSGPIVFTKRDTSVFKEDYFGPSFSEKTSNEGEHFKIKYTNNGDSILFSKDGKRLIRFFSHAGKSTTEKYEIDEPVEIVEPKAFISAKINEVIFPNTLKSIEYPNFDFSKLNKIAIPAKDCQFGPYDLKLYSEVPNINSQTGKKHIKILLRKA